MDETYFLQRLYELDHTQITISGTAKYCIVNYISAQRIVSIIHDQIKQARKDRKLYFIYLMFEIIQESKKKGQQFIQYFGQILKDVCIDLAETIDKFEDIKQIRSCISTWQTQQIYDQQFCEKLQKILLPKYNELQEESSKYVKKGQNKYDKAFIKNYQLIKQILKFQQQYQQTSDACIDLASEFLQQNQKNVNEHEQNKENDHMEIEQKQ
ncbi:ENTH/VHS family protein [Pseudocohnilembus persalinus]|uniref:ENTH/VHS family protein n=1 Tax=Pseudocohnilembus persalinus TaxID=266149 RepID=A0A0V0QNH4_PSEPJ|nr:ENTH/VHS family protein [Pseudocohnilembus persalinus]|eukprot:KRX03798.1 ENTH/VHS family protein [Pseudocohnilembus persalinus]